MVAGGGLRDREAKRPARATLFLLTALAVGSVPPADIGKASGTLNTARQIGSVFGVAVAAAIFEAVGSYSDGLVAAGTAALLGAVATATIVPRRAFALAPTTG